jgi:hypothetical protein
VTTSIATGQRATVPVRVAARLTWLALGFAILGLATYEVAQHNLGLLPLAFLLMPDFAMFAGIGAPHAHGQLPRRAVPFYNALHQPLPPLVLIVAAVIASLPLFWLVAGLAWLAHIVVDRGAGYGLRTADGWQRG